MKKDPAIKLTAQVFLALLILTVGCSRTQTTRFYTLTSLTEPQTDVGAPSSGQGIAVGLGPIALPEYLDRPQIAVRITAGQTSRLRCGAPLQLRVEAKPVGGRSITLLDALASEALSRVSSIEIEVNVIGTGGEQYGGFLRTAKQGAERPRPALFRVLDEKGMVLGTGRMKYG